MHPPSRCFPAAACRSLPVHVGAAAQRTAGTFVERCSTGGTALLQHFAAMRTVTPLLKRYPEEGTLANGIGRIGWTVRIRTEARRNGGLLEPGMIRLIAFQQRLEVKIQTRRQFRNIIIRKFGRFSALKHRQCRLMAPKLGRQLRLRQPQGAPRVLELHAYCLRDILHLVSLKAAYYAPLPGLDQGPTYKQLSTDL